MPLVGTILALVIDLLLPLGLLLWFAIDNFRHRRSNRGEAMFWGLLVPYVAWMSLFVVRAVIDTLQFSGQTVYIAVFFALPLSLVPSVLNSNLMHYFFTTQEWSDFGYLIVLPTFLAGIVVWALLLPVLIRRLVQREAGRRGAFAPVAP